METRVKWHIRIVNACSSFLSISQREREEGRDGDQEKERSGVIIVQAGKKKEQSACARVYVRLCVLTRWLFRLAGTACGAHVLERIAGHPPLAAAAAAAGTVLCIEKDLRNGGRYKEAPHREFIHS